MVTPLWRSTPFAMASILSFWKGSSSKYEPLPRFDHISSRVGSKVVVQGGLTKEKSRRHLSSVVEIFNPYSESWEQRPVTGHAPSPGTFLAASATLHDDLFSFGGVDLSRRFNTLRRLDTEKLCWSQVSPQNAEGAPMPKYGCGMIAFGYGLGVFGGYGVPRGPTEPQSFIKNTASTDGSGWTNEFHIYNLSEGNLSSGFSHYISTAVSNSGRLCFLKKLVRQCTSRVCVIVAPPIHFGAWMTACSVDSTQQQSQFFFFHSYSHGVSEDSLLYLHCRCVELSCHHWRETSSMFALHLHCSR